MRFGALGWFDGVRRGRFGGRGACATVWLLGAQSFAVIAGAPPASAQDNAADRAEMDLAAGRILFQTSPMSVAIVEVQPAPPLAPPPPAPQPRRREVRVVLPSPYAR